MAGSSSQEQDFFDRKLDAYFENKVKEYYENHNKKKTKPTQQRAIQDFLNGLVSDLQESEVDEHKWRTNGFLNTSHVYSNVFDNEAVRKSELSARGDITECDLCGIKLPKNKVLNHSQEPRHLAALKQRSDNLNKENPTGLSQAAAGLVCIKASSDNELLCTLCQVQIPVSKDLKALSRNVSQHIQGAPHIKAVSELGQNKVELAKPDVRNQRSKSHDRNRGRKNGYLFLCLHCKFSGYGYEYCQRHLQHRTHKINYEVVNGMEMVYNIPCDKCFRKIYGTRVSYDVHVLKCEGDQTRERGRSYDRNQQVTYAQQFEYLNVAGSSNIARTESWTGVQSEQPQQQEQRHQRSRNTRREQQASAKESDDCTIL